MQSRLRRNTKSDFLPFIKSNIRKAFQQNREIATKPDNNKTLIGYLENG